MICGDCLETMRDMEPNSVDAIVTDPPYELGFMGKSWDNAGVSYDPDTWRAALRVLKPGGHLLAFGGTRTHHRIMVAIEDAGFEIRDSLLFWGYGSGFPKSLNVSKVLRDKGMSCQCHTDMVQYPYGNSDMSGLQQTAPEEATEPTTKVLLNEVHGDSTANSRHESEAMHDLRQVMDAENALSGDSKVDMLAGMCGEEHQPEETGDQNGSDPNRYLSALREGVRHSGVSEQSPAEILFVPMQRSGTSKDADSAQSQGASVLDGTEQSQLPREDDGAEQPSLEGRSDVFQDARELHGSRVRASAGMGEDDGPQGWLHNGASSHDGEDVRASLGTNRSRQSQGPQPRQQSSVEPRTLADERGPQARGSWPICPRCSKPIIPDGLGTALKPAYEPIVMARKPLIGTVAANVLEHGTGAINVDGCRIGTDEELGRKNLTGPYTSQRTWNTSVTPAQDLDWEDFRPLARESCAGRRRGGCAGRAERGAERASSSLANNGIWATARMQENSRATPERTYSRVSGRRRCAITATPVVLLDSSTSRKPHARSGI